MDRLGKERPLFHSESDFQLALATVVAVEVEQVRLEKKVAVSERVGGRSRLAVDVLGRLGGRAFESRGSSTRCDFRSSFNVWVCMR